MFSDLLFGEFRRQEDFLAKSLRLVSSAGRAGMAGDDRREMTENREDKNSDFRRRRRTEINCARINYSDQRGEERPP